MNLERLALSAEDAIRLSASDRDRRLDELIVESTAILTSGISRFVRADGKRLAGVVALFSGGNDSTTLTHLLRDRATHAGHANTGVGIEETRQFVRDTCAAWNLPLIEKKPPRLIFQYESFVRRHGFPGPATHYVMYRSLKEKAIRKVRDEVIDGRPDHRVVLLAGRRRTESARRANVPEFERDGSMVWISPMVNWTKTDLNWYRRRYDVPTNRVTGLIHMSGECLCGAFAKEGEREEIEYWFPEDFARIRELEERIKDADWIPEYAKKWGWGWNKPDEMPSRSGPMCSSCDAIMDKARHVMMGGGTR